MALLRLALVATVACGRAGAQPTATTTTSGIAAPAGWTALPELARGVSEATAAPGVTIDGAEAWGETARGCYAVWFALHGKAATADAVLAGLAAEKLTATNVVSGDGTVALAFAKAPYTGKLRVRMQDGAMTALACFANEREPASCEAPCTKLLAVIP